MTRPAHLDARCSCWRCGEPVRPWRCEHCEDEFEVYGLGSPLITRACYDCHRHTRRVVDRAEERAVLRLLSDHGYAGNVRWMTA